MCTSTIMHLYYVKYNIHITCVLHIKHVHTTYSLSIYSYCKYTYIYIGHLVTTHPAQTSTTYRLFLLLHIQSSPRTHPTPQGEGVPYPHTSHATGERGAMTMGGGEGGPRTWNKHIYIYVYIYTCGWKLAWQGIWHEYAMMLRMRMLPNLLPVATCRQCPLVGSSHGQTACELASRGG